MEPSGGSSSASSGSGSGAEDAPTTDVNPADDTAGDTDVAGTTGSADAGSGLTGSTGEVTERRIVVFRGPEFTGSAVARVGGGAFNFAANQCREHYNDLYGDIACPGGQVWGLLGSGGNRMEDYPSYPSGHFLDGAAVVATDGVTIIADSYADLIAGNLAVPLMDNAIDGTGVEVLWWGESSRGDPSSNCGNWTMGSPGVLGAAIIVDDINPFYSYEGMPCSQVLPILCICF